MDAWTKRRTITILLQHGSQASAFVDVHGKTPLDYLQSQPLGEATEAQMKRCQLLFTSQQLLTNLAAEKRNENYNLPLVVNCPKESLGTDGLAASRQLEHCVSSITLDDCLVRGGEACRDLQTSANLSTFDKIDKGLNLLDMLGWTCACFY